MMCLVWLEGRVLGGWTKVIKWENEYGLIWNLSFVTLYIMESFKHIEIQLDFFMEHKSVEDEFVRQ